MKSLLLSSAFLFSIISIAGLSVAKAEIQLPNCYDVQGQPVRVYAANTNVPSPAYSTMSQGGRPIIVFNYRMMQQFPQSNALIKYFYLHECGHHALGHIMQGKSSVYETKQNELDADCYAAKWMRKLDERHQTFADIKEVLQEVLTWPTDPEHPAGRVRAQTIMACYRGTN